MTQEISSLMDGELEPHQAGHVVRSCCENPEAARSWETYHVIGDVMRGGKPHPTDTAARVHSALAKEPEIIARPKRKLSLDTAFGRIALAAAASVATIGVVGWLGNQGGQVAGTPLVAKSPSAIQPVSNTATLPAPSVEMRDVYYSAHKQLPYRPVSNSTAPAAATR